MQVILLEDTQQPLEPSEAIAVKFESVKAAQSFLCAEPSEVRRFLDKRILLAAIRAAKAKTDATPDLDEYRSKLEGTLRDLVGETEWNRYALAYTIDPVLATIDPSKSYSPEVSNENCRANLSDYKIAGRAREIYYLSPAVSEAMKVFYFRIPEVIEEERTRTAAIDHELSNLSALFKDASEREAAYDAAQLLLQRALRELPTLPQNAPSPSFLALLRTTAQKAQLNVTLNNWKNVGEARNNMLDGAFESELRTASDAFTIGKTTFIKRIVDLRVRRARSQGDLEVTPRLSNDKSRMAAFIDQDQRVLYIANNVDALKRGAEQAIALNADEPSANPERIRLYASGDNTVQSILDISPDDAQITQADKWRNAKQRGSLLPFGLGFVGISGKHNGVLISARIVRELPKERDH